MDKYYRILLYEVSNVIKLTKAESRMVVAWGLSEEPVFNGYGVSVIEDQSSGSRWC
jgi:hypothetical protein